jgi:hypothetical protein
MKLALCSLADGQRAPAVVNAAERLADCMRREKAHQGKLATLTRIIMRTPLH